MKKLAEIVAAGSTGERGMGKYPAVERRLHTARSHNLPSICTSDGDGGTGPPYRRLTAPPNRNSSGTTRNCEVPAIHTTH